MPVTKVTRNYQITIPSSKETGILVTYDKKLRNRAGKVGLKPFGR